MDNDVTWMKTNRSGAAALTVAGLIRARRVYTEETAKDAARDR